MIEVAGGGVVCNAAYYPNSLAVSVVEHYGQLQIVRRDSGMPISKAYVKVYSRNKNGETVFYKDGYTDIRGKFDYASLSTNQLDNVEKFAILVITEECGSVIREANPPSR
jgi:hypothetical protein